MADLGVRPARPGDADAVAALQIATWQTSYAPLLPPGTFDGLPLDGVRASWAEAIVNPPSARHRLLLALDGATPVGFAASAPAGDDDLDLAVAGELTALIVAPGSTRQGHGSRLLAATVACLRADGATRGYAWVLTADPISQGFYLAAGWAPDGARRQLEMGGALVPEVRLHTDLRD